VPANVDAAIMRALEKLPADRFTGAHGFATALSDAGFRHGPGAEGSRTTVAAPMWRLPAFGSAALSALFAAVAGWAVFRPETPPPFWSPDGRTLYYGTRIGRWTVAARLQRDPVPRVLSIDTLFGDLSGTAPRRVELIHPDRACGRIPCVGC